MPARGKAVVPTDLSIAIPPSTYARVAPRSGLAVKHFIDTAAGVIDEDYRGPVGVVLFNHGPEDFKGTGCGMPSTAPPPISPPLTPGLLLWCSQNRRQDSTTHLGTNSNT